MFSRDSLAELGQLEPLLLSDIMAGNCAYKIQGPLCATARGGLFDTNSSDSWTSIGAWQLGLTDLGYGGNGDYGLETVLVSNTLERSVTTVNSALIAAINTTDFYQGMVGVGATQGRFNGKVANPLISQLAESYNTIPGHSYGFTAGASYGKQTLHFSHSPMLTCTANIPASLTLGGYDSLRFTPHDVTFNLNAKATIPQVLLRGVTVSAKSFDQRPSNWNSTSMSLMTLNTTNTAANLAVIDTSTPFIWLPTAVCDAFAAALNLTWSDTYGVYLFSDSAQYTSFLQDQMLSFTFSFSSFDNTDNFGQPLNVPGVLNITITSAAFAQLLRYPFENQFNFGDPAVPYFPLKRAADNGQLVIGRAFMQEAYMITDYDRQTFSIHQALFPNNANKNYSIVDIDRSDDSPYPGGSGSDHNTMGLTAGQTAGVVIGSFLVGTIAILTAWCCCRRRRRRATKEKSPSTDAEDAVKDDESFAEPEAPISPVDRILSLIRPSRSRRSRRTRRTRALAVTHEVSGDSAQPVEVAADANHELYELPVPMEPVELDSNDPMSTDEITDLGTESSQGLSAYEIARRKMERQLQGPVPTYAPPGDKSDQDISPVAHYRPPENPSPVSSPSPTYGNNSNSIPSLPSPMTPHLPDWTTRQLDLPSPMTVAPPMPSPPFPTTLSNPNSTYNTQSAQSPVSPRTYAPSSMSRSDSSQNSPTSPFGSLIPPSPTYQRTPIDPSRIICLGPLPENVQLPHHQPSLPRIAGSDGRSVPQSSISPLGPVTPAQDRVMHRRRSTDTLGSNFTVEEETRIQEELTRQQSLPETLEMHSPRSPRSQERIDTGLDFVHVPQLAERRYSWEDDR